MRKFLFSFFLILLSIFSFSQEIFAANPALNCMSYYPKAYANINSCPIGTTNQTNPCKDSYNILICSYPPASMQTSSSIVHYCCSKFPNSNQAQAQWVAYNNCVTTSQKLIDPPTATVTEARTACNQYETLIAAEPMEWDGAFTEDPCTAIKEASSTCRYCMYGDKYPSKNSDVIGFWTGIGCISTNPMGAISQLTTFLLGVVGVFIFFQILIGAFTLLTSKGSPQAVQSARERITNSIIALLLIIFSVTILQFVGVNILHIPGFFDN